MNTKVTPSNYLVNLGKLIVLIYGAFLFLFALEGEAKGGVAHLVPPLIVIGLLIISWDRPKLSALLFAALFIFSVGYFETYNNAALFFAVSFPLAVASALFQLGGRLRNPTHVK